MRSILCPIDYSNVSDNALEYACELASRNGAEIFLLHAYHIPVPISESPISAADLEFKKLNEQTLKTAADHLRKKYPALKFTTILRMGFATEVILQESELVDYNLIIMGISGAGSLSRYMIGSNAISVSRRSEIPVMIIPEKVRFSPYNKIVFATDLEEIETKSSLDCLLELSDQFQSEIIVTHVVNNNTEMTFEKAINGMQIENKFRGRKHSFHFAMNEDVIDGLKFYSNRHHADMISMIGHEHNFLYRMINETHLKKMAYETNLPLLSLPNKVKTNFTEENLSCSI